MSSSQDLVTLGKLGAVYGVKGWLKVHSYTDDAESIFDYSPWELSLGGQSRVLKVTDWRRHNKGLIAKFDGVDDREDAQRLVGIEISVALNSLPELEDDEFYWRDLIGMRVVNASGYDMGEVVRMMETGSNDVLVVKANSKDAFGKRERLIPFVEGDFIKHVDKTTKSIEVDWDPGF